MIILIQSLYTLPRSATVLQPEKGQNVVWKGEVIFTELLAFGHFRMGWKNWTFLESGVEGVGRECRDKENISVYL